VRRAPVVVFGVLVAATFAAFFVAQRLKNSPSVIQRLRVDTFGIGGDVFSPNGDGRRDRVRFALRLKKADHVTLAIVNTKGDVVRTVLSDRAVKAYTTIGQPGVPWDGRDDAGRMVPDGRYRLRITLRDQGRSVLVPRSVLKDTTPPKPRVTAIGPQKGPGPELLPEPDGSAARIHFGGALAAGRIHIFRTAPGAPREVRSAGLTAAASPSATSAPARRSRRPRPVTASRSTSTPASSATRGRCGASAAPRSSARRSPRPRPMSSSARRAARRASTSSRWRRAPIARRSSCRSRPAARSAGRRPGRRGCSSCCR
jgi:hypothetical protein